MTKSEEEGFKNANLLAGDAIQNYRTVASFANEEQILKLFDEHLLAPYKKASKAAHVTGIIFGFS